jgi:MarR family transcriptional regulator, organic hydroperoxide resistance regulator
METTVDDAVAGASANLQRRYEAYRQLSAAFIELDVGDGRFLQAFSRWLFGPASELVLTIPRFWALVHLGTPQGRTMKELAQLLLCDNSNVTAIVDKLEKFGWATRERGKAGDRRFTSVALTPEGRRVRDLAVPAHTAWVSTRFAGLGDAELVHLASLLSSVRPGLQTDPDLVAELEARRANLQSAAPAAAPQRDAGPPGAGAADALTGS